MKYLGALFLALISYSTFVEAAVAGSLRDDNHVSGWVLRIPGNDVLNPDQPIDFSASLKLRPDTVELNTTAGSQEKEAPVDPDSWYVTGPDGRKYFLSNSESIVHISTPVHVEAPIVIRNGKAVAGEIVPDSVAAWARLKSWSDMKQALSGAEVAAIDAAADEVARLMRRFLADRVPNELVAQYQAYSALLVHAIDKVQDFDVQRQISMLIAGARSERIAWQRKFSGCRAGMCSGW